MEKNFLKILVIILILLIVIGGIIWGIMYFNKPKHEELQDYVPQAEITDEQLRKTIISLYFLAKDKEEIISEARLIDAKLLLNDPYTFLLNLLLEGPKNDDSISLIPRNTIINKVYLKGDTVYVDLSESFIKEFEGDENKKKLMIESILRTLSQLNEVNNLSILIDGKEMK